MLGFVTLRLLPDGPDGVRWLAAEDRAWIARELAAEADALGERGHGSPLRALRDRRVVLLSLFYLCFPLGAYGLSFWLPTIVDGFGGLSTTATGFITAVPYVFVAIGLYVVPKLADRSGTRYPWIAGTAALGALGLAASALTGNHVLQMAFISVAAMCIFAGQPVLWSLPTLPDGNSGSLRHRGDQRRGQSGRRLRADGNRRGRRPHGVGRGRPVVPGRRHGHRGRRHTGDPAADRGRACGGACVAGRITGP